jgi:uncharacterized protein YcnI
MRHRIALVAVVAVAALVAAASASAHARISPPVAVSGQSQVFTLAVPTEKEGATTTSIELTPPAGFSIDSFFPSPGWKRVVQQTGSGDNAEIKKVTWSGGAVPTGEDAAFSFLALTSKTGSYTFLVRQTYSDGTVVDWSGPESADTPAPVVKAVSSVGGSGASTLEIVALVLGGVALVIALVALLARGGRSIA